MLNRSVITSAFTSGNVTSAMFCVILFFPLLSSLPAPTLSSQLSCLACGLTVFVNIYYFFCMTDMESLVSLLLQRMDWNLPVGRGERKGHSAEMLINKDPWARHWMSTTSMELLRLCSPRAALSSLHQSRDQKETQSTISWNKSTKTRGSKKQKAEKAWCVYH